MNEIHVIFFGHVQGVGFRYTTRRFALSLGLRGWVRNNMDGTVEMVAQGRAEDLQKLMASIQNHFSGDIDRIDAREAVAQDQLESFSIRF